MRQISFSLSPAFSDPFICIEIEVHGPETPGYGSFVVKTERINPAPPGAVTGQQTYLSFLSSLLRAQGRGSGVHFC